MGRLNPEAMISSTKARCSRCLMHQELCLCADIPQIDTLTRVVLLMHAQEIKKPSNTGRLAHLCLPNSEIRLRGLPDRTPLDLKGIVDETHETWMLFYSPHSEELNHELVNSAKKPVRLLVPDGTWNQASRLGSMLSKRFSGVKCVKLKADVPSEYRLRSEHDPNGMATFEAIARALGQLEGPEVRTRMEKIFRVMVERVLYTRGKIGAEEVSGGLPVKRPSR